MAKVSVADDASTKSYYKYYEMGIAGLTPEQMQFVANCKGTADEALSIHDRKKLQEPGTYPEKMGYFPLKEGGMLVAGNIPMPGVTAEMLQWWFAWHGLEPLRYAIWDPEDHYNVQLNEEGRRLALDPNVPLAEKTWGATHTVQESIGGPPDEIVIMFTEPAKLGFDNAKIGTEGCEFMVVANALMGEMKVPVVMVEVAKKIDGVMTFQARFWVGYHIIDGEAKYLLPPEVKLPEEVAQGLIGHNIKEFSNLAKILPQVYAEESGKPML
ncbi:MAG: phloretin hydrolase [Clostridiales bacterium]|nr:phloretin hydrolase [Clostridiales bacterium]